jgi:membrane fusion protein (multidrug efflux system)
MHRPAPSARARVLLLASLALAAAGCGQSAPQQAAPAAPQVGVHTVQPKRVSIKTTLPGRTAPTGIAEVRPQVTGLIRARNFREGAEVKAGATLYQLDASTYQAALDSARANVAKAEATLQSAKLRADRYRELVAIKFISQQEYDNAQAALQQAEAELAAARAAVETARINVGYTQVKAPISGRVGKSTVNEGALVTANQQAALVTIQQLNPIYVDVTQSSAEVLRLRRALASGELRKAAKEDAARVVLLLEDGTTYAHEGALQFADVTVDQTTGAINLRALFPNPNGLLLPGMYVQAEIEEGVREAAIVVPQQAVTRDNKGQPVAMVVGPDGKVEARLLQVARSLGNGWLVDGGLKAGERVIVEGLQRSRPGAVVQAVERSEPGNAAPQPAKAEPQPPGPTKS